jgi:uncharacterized protein YcbK (DUF882 family)
VPAETARKAKLKVISVAGQRMSLAAAFFFFGSQSLQSVVANGDTRTISFHHLHTGEDLTVTFKRDGRYDEAALEKINYVMRDWRVENPIKMDPHLIDLLWEVHREVGATDSIHIVCGYRSAGTNAMLRARSRGVAQFSQHMLGKAVDFYIPGVELSHLREVGLRLQRGGVGFYPTSGSPFVHLDTGGVRHWPKASRDLLVRIFPDGKTVHIPADGRPMPGYELALAEIKARDGNVDSYAVASRGTDEDGASANAGGTHVKQFFAGLFGKKKEETDDEESRITTVRSRPAVVATASKTVDAARAVKPLALAAIDTPQQRNPQMQWVTGPGVNSTEANAAAPLPRPRPANSAIASLTSRQLASAGGVTAALPAAITGNTGLESRALGYAVTDSGLVRNNPVASPAQQAVPQSTPRGRVTGPAPIVKVYADAANAPVTLLSGNQIQYSGELRQPDHSTAMTLIESARTALRVQFGSNAAELPAMSRFAGPAVVALPTVIFGREAALVPGRQAFSAN